MVVVHGVFERAVIVGATHVSERRLSLLLSSWFFTETWTSLRQRRLLLRRCEWTVNRFSSSFSCILCILNVFVIAVGSISIVSSSVIDLKE